MSGRRFPRRWCMAMLAGIGALGCQHTSTWRDAQPPSARYTNATQQVPSPYGALPASDMGKDTVQPSFGTVTDETQKPAANLPATPAHATAVSGRVTPSASGIATLPKAMPKVLPPTAVTSVDTTNADNSPGSHAPNYGWIEGQLYYVRSRNSWRLRYGQGKTADRYGGIVTLLGDGVTSTCQDGQIVRVEGTLLDPDSTEPQPDYWVRHLTVVKQAPRTAD